MPPRSNLGAERRARLAAARLYLVCDSRPGGRELAHVLRAAIVGGVEVVQLRDKRLGAEELTAVAREAAAICAELGALFVVNDHPAIALEVGADGVHVGQDDMPVERVRGLVGAEMLVGLSTHTPAEVTAACGRQPSGGALGADENGDNPTRMDYIGVGPVHSTPTKPGRPATGLELVRHAAADATVPFFAIGGIHAGNTAAVLAAGAQRVAVVRAVAEAPDPGRAAADLRAVLGGVA